MGDQTHLASTETVRVEIRVNEMFSFFGKCNNVNNNLQLNFSFTK